ncbi:MAG: CIA30 family protein [Acidobacteria bacterium]|nr:CIA30 family protein [Acidobacteriota bacterium]MBI3658748.1 CIA30 family protein [Acidobacteriota bacterium]
MNRMNRGQGPVKPCLSRTTGSRSDYVSRLAAVLWLVGGLWGGREAFSEELLMLLSGASTNENRTAGGCGRLGQGGAHPVATAPGSVSPELFSEEFGAHDLTAHNRRAGTSAEIMRCVPTVTGSPIAVLAPPEFNTWALVDAAGQVLSEPLSAHWLRGYLAGRKPQKASRPAKAAAPSGSRSGWVSDFESGQPLSKFGAGWSLDNDNEVGGESYAEMRVVASGAHGSKGSLLITGIIEAGIEFPWAGILFSPGQVVKAPANLSAKKKISFWAKGDGRQYQIMIFTATRGRQPAIQPFVAGPVWQPFVFSLAQFAGTDGHDIYGLLFAAGPEPGLFTFQIDDVRFR